MAACRLRSPEKHAADQRRVLPRRTVATALHARAPEEHISPASASAIFGVDGGEQKHGALATHASIGEAIGGAHHPGYRPEGRSRSGHGEYARWPASTTQFPVPLAFKK